MKEKLKIRSCQHRRLILKGSRSLAGALREAKPPEKATGPGTLAGSRCAWPRSGPKAGIFLTSDFASDLIDRHSVLTSEVARGRKVERRQKPTGSQGWYRLGAPGEDPPLTVTRGKIIGTKEEIEAEIVTRAMSALKQSGQDPYHLNGAPTQNLECDFDFTLRTERGTEFLELTEFAPLNIVGGSYENVPPVHDAELFAGLVWEAVMSKSRHYAGLQERLHLMLYTTECKLHLSTLCQGHLAYRAQTETHLFQSIVYALPLASGRTFASVIFPKETEVKDPRIPGRKCVEVCADLNDAQLMADGERVFIPFGKYLADSANSAGRDSAFGDHMPDDAKILYIEIEIGAFAG